MKRTHSPSAERPPTAESKAADTPPEKENQEAGSRENQATPPAPQAQVAEAQSPESVPLGLSEGVSNPKPALSVPPILLEGDESTRPSNEGSGQKFAPTPDSSEIRAQHAPVFTINRGPDRVLLVARDPGCLYAHWDIHGRPDRQQAQAADLVLRIHRDTSTGPVIAEKKVAPGSDHAFIAIQPSGGKYIARLGYPTEKSWESLAVSDAIVTPFPTGQDQGPARFATLDFPLPDSTAAAGFFPPKPSVVAEPTALPTPTTAVTPQKSGSTLRPEFPLVTVSRVGRTDMATSDVAASAPTPTPSFEFDPEDESLGAAWAPAVEQELSPSWTAAQAHALAELIGWSVLRHRRVASEEVVSLLQGEALRGGLLSETLALRDAGAISSESVPAVAPVESPGFWLTVNTELVVYGATEPNAKVTLGGQAVQLRPDGSFSYRFALPDGTFQLPVEAVSPAGDRRVAALTFFRGSTYSGEVGVHPQNPELGPPESKRPG